MKNIPITMRVRAAMSGQKEASAAKMKSPAKADYTPKKEGETKTWDKGYEDWKAKGNTGSKEEFKAEANKWWDSDAGQTYAKKYKIEHRIKGDEKKEGDDKRREVTTEDGGHREGGETVITKKKKNGEKVITKTQDSKNIKVTDEEGNVIKDVTKDKNYRQKSDKRQNKSAFIREHGEQAWKDANRQQKRNVKSDNKRYDEAQEVLKSGDPDSREYKKAKKRVEKIEGPDKKGVDQGEGTPVELKKKKILQVPLK